MIRLMQSQDESRVEEIWYQESVLVHNWMDHPEEFWGNRRQDFRSTLAKESSQRLVLVENDVVAAFILKWPNNYIPELFVDRQYRLDSNGNSKQLGRALLDYLKASNSILTASVYMLNHKAVKFYVRNDFVITRLYAEGSTGFAKLSVEWKANKREPGAMSTLA